MCQTVNNSREIYFGMKVSMTIYTRTGDQGETDLLGGARVQKDVLLLEVCGVLDELNALLGLVRCEPISSDMASLLVQVQRQLFAVGGQLVASDTNQEARLSIGPQDVAALEELIDRYESGLGVREGFLLPGGCRAAALFHVARAVCRRTERRMVSLARAKPSVVTASLLSYMNRLSDLLFVMAVASNVQAGITDTEC